MKKFTLKNARENALYIPSFIKKGNAKMKDYNNPETGKEYRYAQYNLRARKDCPYASAGCLLICYATTGRHNCPSVAENREKSFVASLAPDFSSRMIYTIETEMKSGRYNGKHMMLRVHESGDFYSLEYLKKWIAVFEHFMNSDNLTNCFYTKSFQFFLDLSESERNIVNKCLEKGVVAMSLSLDDTTTLEQLTRAYMVKKLFPLANIYRCTETPDALQHDNKCDCADCAKCGHCTRTTGKITVVKIHSATETTLVKYRKKSRKTSAA